MDVQVDTHSTTSSPHPAATSTRQSSGAINMKYLKSADGFMKVFEFVLGLLAWALVASSYTHREQLGAYQYVLFVTVTAWLISLITLVIYLFDIHTNYFPNAPWNIMECVNNLTWGTLTFIAGCVVSSFTEEVPQLIAGSVFTFFTAIVYLIHGLYGYRVWRGYFPWQYDT